MKRPNFKQRQSKAQTWNQYRFATKIKVSRHRTLPGFIRWGERIIQDTNLDCVRARSMCKEKKKENLEIRSMHLEPRRLFETIKPFGSHIFRQIQRAKPKGKEGIVGTGEEVPGRCEQEAAIHGALPWLQRTSAPQAQTSSDHADIEGENPRAKGTNGLPPLLKEVEVDRVARRQTKRKDKEPPPEDSQWGQKKRVWSSKLKPLEPSSSGLTWGGGAKE